MQDTSNPTEQWWLVVLGDTLIWSRLRLRESGTAEVLDSDGNTLSYDSPDSARAALMDAEFRALDGMDEDDARTLGLSLHALTPPQGEDAALRALMVQALPRQH
jgi:hypothetical protein